ncbi:hypothetical protein [Prescottella agglutinans]|uniref:DNA-binding protein n=1 Tax=Prescottella agglutinans TaxID=1644129 RepID=A0ABT6MH00_9NOCA|nr:hypothetical protein [Prescottella agglutinans]MDH6283139.1 hypothetical protein [Prescottella agglutinans]
MTANQDQPELTVRKGSKRRKDAQIGAVADPAIAYDIQGAADMLSLSYTEIKRAMDEGSLQAKTRGTKPLILRKDAEDFANNLPAWIPPQYRRQ